MAHDQPEFPARILQREYAKLREEVQHLAGLVKLVHLVKQADQERLSVSCAEFFAASEQNSDLEICRTARELALRCAQLSRESSSRQTAQALEEFSVLLADHVGALEAISQAAQSAEQPSQ